MLNLVDKSGIFASGNFSYSVAHMGRKHDLGWAWKHQHAGKQLRDPPPRRKRLADSFFKSASWIQVRYQALKLHGSKCQCCGTEKAVMHVDHIKPRSSHPHLALSLSNLQVLCAPCNLGKGYWDDTDWRPTEGVK